MKKCKSCGALRPKPGDNLHFMGCLITMGAVVEALDKLNYGECYHKKCWKKLNQKQDERQGNNKNRG